MVKEVEEFRTKTKLDTFAKVKLSLQRHVDLRRSKASQDIPSEITLLTGWRLTKGRAGEWLRKTCFKSPEDWVFASPFRAGRMPSDPWSAERRHIIPAAIRCGIGRVGWHSFRNTFRTLLDETGAPMKVQQELMRHADIRTTMNKRQTY